MRNEKPEVESDHSTDRNLETPFPVKSRRITFLTVYKELLLRKLKWDILGK